MHTIFINTSKREFDFDIDILDMQREVDKFVDYHCCSCNWGIGSDDYVKCAENISTLIDNNKALSHKYNLIAYSDLMDYDVYAELVRDKEKSVQDKRAAVELLKGAICALYKNTLYYQLSEQYSSAPTSSATLETLVTTAADKPDGNAPMAITSKAIRKRNGQFMRNLSFLRLKYCIL